jgi:hypothetical protein
MVNRFPKDMFLSRDSPAGERIQWLAAKFPTQPNREFLKP